MVVPRAEASPCPLRGLQEKNTHKATVNKKTERGTRAVLPNARSVLILRHFGLAPRPGCQRNNTVQKPARNLMSSAT